MPPNTGKYIIGSLDRYLTKLGGTLSDPEPQYNPIEFFEDEPQWILFKLTGSDVKEIISALMTGADLIYPEKNHEVGWHFIKHVEYPYMLCDLIAQCIAASTGTGNALEQALEDWLEDHQGDALTGGAPHADDDMLSFAECDYDYLYGACRQLVDWMDKAIRDLFEAIEGFTNFIDYWHAFAARVPILAQFIELAEAIQDSFYDAYLLNHTDSLEVEYACDLFCLAIANDCKLSWSLVEQYFADKMEFDPNDTLGILVQIILTGTFQSEEYVAMFYHLLAIVLFKGESWIGVDLDTVRSLIASFSNDPDADWSIVCETCSSWRAIYDLSADDCNLLIGSQGGNPTALYVVGEGYAATNWVEPVLSWKNTRCLVYMPITGTVNVTRAEMEIAEWVSGGGFNNGDWEAVFASQYSTPLVAAPTSAQGTFAKSYLLETDNLGGLIDVRSTNHNRYGGSVIVSKLTIWGTGTPPDEIIDNATSFTYL